MAAHGYNTRNKVQNRSSGQAFSHHGLSGVGGTVSARYSSSSSWSKVESIGDIPKFMNDIFSEDRGVKTACYSLKEIAEYCKVSWQSNIDDRNNAKRKQLNDEITTACVRSIGVLINPNWQAKANCEVAAFKKLQPMICSERQRPDTAVYYGNEVGFTSETCSSPMLWTERKATLGAADLLRLQRWKGYTDINSITTFAFPNMQESSCLTEITVTWKSFRFYTKLTRHSNMVEGLKRLEAVLAAQCSSIFNHPRPYADHFPGPCNAMVRLSRAEMVELLMEESGGLEESGAVTNDPVQMMFSTHVLMVCNNTVYKVVYNANEVISLLTVHSLYANKEHDRLIKLQPNIEKKMKFGIDVFQYPKVKYAPLKVEDARQYLGYLVTEIRECIVQLHSIGLSHNDVRLENICFNGEYKAVFIDMDRCCYLSNVHPLFQCSSRFNSCMYSVSNSSNFKSGKTDYYQLGWLVAWVLDTSSENYHQRTWDTQDAAIKNNRFISELICTGSYKCEILPESWLRNGKSLQTVLEERHQK